MSSTRGGQLLSRSASRLAPRCTSRVIETNASKKYGGRFHGSNQLKRTVCIRILRFPAALMAAINLSPSRCSMSPRCSRCQKQKTEAASPIRSSEGAGLDRQQAAQAHRRSSGVMSTGRATFGRCRPQSTTRLARISHKVRVVRRQSGGWMRGAAHVRDEA